MKKIILFLILSAMLMTGCAPEKVQPYHGDDTTVSTGSASEKESTDDNPRFADTAEQQGTTVFDPSKVPEYSGDAWVTVNGDVPYFTEDELTTETYIQLSELDELGRCGLGIMCAGVETMPDGERGEIGMIKPTGWVQEKYPDVIKESPSYLYNRAHILMWALSGVNADERGLITGTRYMNIEGILPNEETVVDYIEATGDHVMYRVTPVFTGDNLPADGVLMEAQSVESDGLIFCRYAYNVQPGIMIDYATGESHTEDSDIQTQDHVQEKSEATYVGNKNSMIFHLPDCISVSKMKEKNRVYFYRNRKEPISQGYNPCGGCNP